MRDPRAVPLEWRRRLLRTSLSFWKGDVLLWTIRGAEFGRCHHHFILECIVEVTVSLPDSTKFVLQVALAGS